MTKEINQLSTKELKKLQEGIEIIKKVYGLDDDGIDVFFRLAKNAGAITEQLNNFQKRIESLERAYLHETSVNDAEKAKKLYKAMNTPLEAFKL